LKEAEAFQEESGSETNYSGQSKGVRKMVSRGKKKMGDNKEKREGKI